MRAIGLCAVPLLSLLLACNSQNHRSSTPDTVDQDAQGTETVVYENTRFAFAVRLPATWTVEERAENGDGIRVMLPKVPDGQIRVYGGHNVWGIRDLDGLQNLYEEFDGSTKGAAARISMAGLPGIEYSREANNAVTKHRLLLHGDMIYGLYVEAAPKAWPKALQAFEQVCDAFEAQN